MGKKTKTLLSFLLLIASVSIYGQDYKQMQLTGQVIAISGAVIAIGGVVLNSVANTNLNTEDIDTIELGAEMKQWAIPLICAGGSIFLTGMIINMAGLSKEHKIQVKLNQSGLTFAYRF